MTDINKKEIFESLIESLINDFRDYQKEWLTSHDDFELDKPNEDLILEFLDNTAYCYIESQ